MGDSTLYGHGSYSPIGGLDDGDDPYPSRTVDPLIQHPAVLQYGSGVQSEMLADFIQRFSRLSSERVVTVGHDQYAGGGLQKFERKTIDVYVDELVDECADIINYASIIALKALALKGIGDQR